MSEQGPEVIRIDEFSGREDALELDPARLAAGSQPPAQFVRNLYTDDTGRFFGGIWRSSQGAWHVSYTENELCVLTEGKVRISDDHGRSWTFGPATASSCRPVSAACGKCSSRRASSTPSTSRNRPSDGRAPVHHGAATAACCAGSVHCSTSAPVI